jgi:hypothetical protein
MEIREGLVHITFEDGRRVVCSPNTIRRFILLFEEARAKSCIAGLDCGNVVPLRSH